MKESKKQWNQNLDAESGVVRDIDFKNVHTVINVQMPSTAAGYIHRIGRTGRACNTGSSVCLVSQEEMEAFEELKSTLAEHTSGVDLIAPFPLPLGNAVELLRYRTEASTLVKCSSSQSKRVREEIDDGGESAAILKSVKQYWISCDAREKFTHIIAFLKKNLVPKKVLLFTASINLGYKLKLFLKKFAIKAAVLNPDLTQTMRVHTVSEFNAGSFDYLIAIHDGGAVTLEPEASGENASDRFNTQWKQTLNDRFGVVIGTELKDVSTVIHFDMPRTAAGYIHRIGRTGRESNPRASVCLVSPDEMETFEEVKSKLAAYRSEKEEFIVPFGLFEPYGVDILRFQARAIERTVTVAAQNSH